MVDLHNPLAKSFRYARDHFKEDSKTNMKLKLIKKGEKNGRRYNLPTASVAILIVGDIDESSLQRDIILETTSNKLKRIDVLHPSYLSLQYPLIFLYGEDGFILVFRGLPETEGRSRRRSTVVAGAVVSDLLDLVVLLILDHRRVVVPARDSDA
ncbi:hypothetical protein AHAS_Ahas17G0213400 [Arachis hypogaea]